MGRPGVRGLVARAVRPPCEAALAWAHGAAEPTATTLGRCRSNPWETLILLDGPERAVNTGKLRARRIEAAEILWLSVDSRVTRWGEDRSGEGPRSFHATRAAATAGAYSGSQRKRSPTPKR